MIQTAATAGRSADCMVPNRTHLFWKRLFAGDRRQEPKQSVPEPSMSKLRQMWRLARDPFQLVAEARAECGDLFALHFPGLGKTVFVCSARLLDEIYRRGDDEIVAGEIRKKIIGYLVGTRSSISIDGEEYKRRRQVMAPYFAGHGLHRYAPTLHDLAETMVARWPEDRPFRLLPFFEEVSCRTICRILFGPLEQPANEKLVDLSSTFLEAFHSPAVQLPPLQWDLGRWTPWGRFVAARKRLREALETEIRVREQTLSSDCEDLMSALIAARLEEDPGEAREVVVQEMLNLLVGGGGTTATSLAWTFLGLLSNPESLARLEEEIRRVLGGEPMSPSHFSEMPYLDAVLQEGLRYQPVAPAAGPRVARKDIELGGFTIPEGTVLLQCLSEVGRNPEVFVNPGSRFDPDNFFGRSVRTRDWMPFGGGSRMCTGMGLARFEMAVCLTTILRRAELELGPGSVRPARHGIVYQPENGLNVRMVRRLS